jgi:exonuclease SbcC
MRPSRLEIEGFTSFRERTVVEFDDVDVFALVGPTGSGKSSIVDAMGFALYGRVHRYGEKLVHAVISQGRNEARVRLDFTAGGSVCTAVRVVRRVGPGRATTKEARLERDGDVVAGDEKSLTAVVTELLGLDFEQYCRCVVLPQGAFAEFLHDTPKGRQELLSNLLDLGHYRRMGQEAGQRAALARTRAELFAERLVGDLAGATVAARDHAAAVVAQLDALADKIAAAAPQLDDLAARRDAAAARAEAAAAAHRLLAAVAAPRDLASLAGALKTARQEAAAATEAADDAERTAVDATLRRDALGDRRSADAAIAGHRRRTELLQRRQTAVAGQAAALDASARAAGLAEAAAQRRSAADAALEAARTANRAHALVEQLQPGQPCPVCRQVVHVVPEAEVPADFRAAQQAAQETDDACKAAAAAFEKTTRAQAQADAELAAIDHQVTEVEGDISGFPDETEAAAVVARIEEAEAAAARAQRADRAARDTARKTAERVAALIDEEARVRRAFEAVRDTVGALGPPPPERVDLAADWRQLADWATTRQHEVDAEADAALDDARRLAAERSALGDEVAGWCAIAGVEARDRAPAEAVAAAHGRAEAEHQRIVEAIEEAEGVETELARLRQVEQVAHSLAVHLRADRFEKWLLDEALDELTDGATTMLHELSNGAYSLVLDDRTRDFAVVDHRNADEVRPVRTLSGGETFLASLALALALSERVAELAAAGAVKLEALFLDEGFGTLDADTLDVVASAIENLAASGRMVGLVTHVRDLAERVPARFEVAKDAVTSTVEKVMA